MTRPPRRPLIRPSARPAAEPLEGRAYFSPVVFAKPTSYAVGPVGTDPDAMATADLNGDGHVDVVTANYGNDTVSVLTGTGTGGFNAYASYPVQPPGQAAATQSPESVAVGDLNADGHPDVVTANEASDTVSVLVNNGDGTLAPAVQLPVGPHPEGVVLTDLTGDGLPDIVTANEGDGTVTVLMNQPADPGTFAPAVTYHTGGTEVDAIAAGDLNGDGFPDLVTVDPADDTLSVLLNNGDGTFPATPAQYATDTTGRAVAIADTNDDGRPDLIVANLRAADVGVLLNSGQGVFQGQVTSRTGGFPFGLATGDVNGDNRVDIITADSRDNAIGVLIHNGAGGFDVGNGGTTDSGSDNGTDGEQKPREYPTGVAPEAVAVADLNGDGKPDLISADFNDDAVAVLLNQSVFPPLTPTAVTLTASRATAEAGTPVTFTAAVTPAPSPGFTAGRVVQFLDGDKVLGVAPLSAAGTATVTTSALQAGVVSVVARYSGNAHYTGSVTALNETVLSTADAGDTPLVTVAAVAVNSRAGRASTGVPRVTAAAVPSAVPSAVPADAADPLLAPTAVAIAGRAGAPLQPGVGGSATVTITDQQAGVAVGSVAVSLSIAPADGSSAAVPLAVTSGGTVAVALQGGHALAVPVGFTVPAALPAGSYTVLATLAPVAGTFTAAQVSAVPIATAAAVSVVSVLVPFVPGDAGSVAVTIANRGPGQATGSVAVSLSVAPAGDTAAAVPLAAVGPSTFAVHLRGGATRVVQVRFTLPATLAAGEYTVLAALTPVATLTAAEVDSTPAATATAAPVVTAFGAVGVHRQYALTTTLPGGATVTVGLKGPGTGVLTETPGSNAIGVALTDTTGGSTVTITPAAGSAPVTIASLSTPYPLGIVSAPAVTVVDGSVFLSDGVRRLTVAGATDTSITLGPAFKSDLSLGVVAGTSLAASGQVQSLAVTSWTATSADTITATGIRGALTAAGDFGPRVTLTGLRLGVALGSAAIGGADDSSAWIVGTRIGAISVGGDLADTDILSGASVGADGLLGGNDDRFNVGRITSVQVGGSVVGSLVAAGFRPASDDPFSPVGGTLIPGGAIGPITVAGTVDAASRFAAASLPVTVTVGGAAVRTAGDPRFG